LALYGTVSLMADHVAALSRSCFFSTYGNSSLSAAAVELNTVTVSFTGITRISSHLLLRLQAVQNAAGRLITGTRRYQHMTPILCELDWLPVGQRFYSRRLCWCTNVSMVWLQLTCRHTAHQLHHTVVGVTCAVPSLDNYMYHVRGPQFCHQRSCCYQRVSIASCANCWYSQRRNVRLSVRLSVTHRYCIKTKKASVMISSPSESLNILVSINIWLITKFDRGHPKRGQFLRLGWVRTGDFGDFSANKSPYLRNGAR